MEQNFQKQTAGHSGDLLRRGAGAAGADACVVCFAVEGAASRPDWDAVRQCARTHRARVLAYYICRRDLGHYGRVDHLAPAGAMDEFTRHVRAQDMAAAREAFAPLLPDAQEAATVMDGLAVRVDVLYGKKSMAGCLQSLSAATEQVFVFMPERAEG